MLTLPLSIYGHAPLVVPGYANDPNTGWLNLCAWVFFLPSMAAVEVYIRVTRGALGSEPPANRAIRREGMKAQVEGSE